jgi:hypothetical protein
MPQRVYLLHIVTVGVAVIVIAWMTGFDRCAGNACPAAATGDVR